MLIWIHDQLLLAGFDSKTIRKVELASEEVFVNIINHGYRQKPGTIEITIHIIPKSRAEIEIKDTAPPFDPLKKKKKFDLNAPIEEREIGGLGIHFVKKCMDEVHYRREGNANILTLIKKLS